MTYIEIGCLRCPALQTTSHGLLSIRIPEMMTFANNPSVDKDSQHYEEVT
jgi:hypothetical protein